MRLRILNYIISGILLLTLVNCKNDSKSNLIYTELGKEIEIVLENGADHLVVGETTKANFKTKNIDNSKLMILGEGIKKIPTNKDGFQFTITPVQSMLTYGKMKILVTESIGDGEKFSHAFLVPLYDRNQNNRLNIIP